MVIKKISRIIGYILVIVNLIILLSNIHTSEKVKFNILEAENLLKETYKPLEDFNKNLSVTEDEKLLLIPSYIQCKEDFINMFNGKMTDRISEGFYEDLIIEKDKKVYVDALAYIPNIYIENGQVITAYIKKKRRLFPNFWHSKYKEDEKLKITETWEISGEMHRRSNYFIKNESGKWILDYFNGTSLYGFTHINDNPWNLNRLRNKV